MAFSTELQRSQKYSQNNKEWQILNEIENHEYIKKNSNHVDER